LLGPAFSLDGVAAPALFPLRLLFVGEAANGDPTSVDANGDFGGGSCVICTPRSTGLVDSMVDIDFCSLESSIKTKSPQLCY
jgi:hypothetical protein